MAHGAAYRTQVILRSAVYICIYTEMYWYGARGCMDTRVRIRQLPRMNLSWQTTCHNRRGTLTRTALREGSLHRTRRIGNGRVDQNLSLEAMLQKPTRAIVGRLNPFGWSAHGAKRLDPP